PARRTPPPGSRRAGLRVRRAAAGSGRGQQDPRGVRASAAPRTGRAASPYGPTCRGGARAVRERPSTGDPETRGPASEGRGGGDNPGSDEGGTCPAPVGCDESGRGAPATLREGPRRGAGRPVLAGRE